MSMEEFRMYHWTLMGNCGQIFLIREDIYHQTEYAIGFAFRVLQDEGPSSYADRYKEGEIHLNYVRRTDFTDVDADVLVNNYDAVTTLARSNNRRSFTSEIISLDDTLVERVMDWKKNYELYCVGRYACVLKHEYGRTKEGYSLVVPVSGSNFQSNWNGIDITKEQAELCLANPALIEQYWHEKNGK